MLTFKYKNVDSLPLGHTSDKVTPGCIVLEGGAFRGVYTSGVLDRLMQADINMDCTIGVSAGAMNGFNYVSGQSPAAPGASTSLTATTRAISATAPCATTTASPASTFFSRNPECPPFR